MTNPRIGHFSPPESVIADIDDATWAEIEAVYSITLADGDRQHLSDIRQKYILWRQAEEYGERQEAADKILMQLAGAADAMRYIARFTGTGDDAAFAVGHFLKRAYGDSPISINPHHLFAISENEPRLVRALADEYAEPLYVALSRELIGEVSRSIDMALESARRSILAGGTVKKGDALSGLDRALYLWAKARDLAFGLSKDSSRKPAAYQQLVYLLDKTLPADLQSFRSGSAENIANTLQSARKRWDIDGATSGKRRKK